MDVRVRPTADPEDKGEYEAKKDRYEARNHDDFASRDWDSYDDWVRDRSRRDRSSPYFRERDSRLDIPYGHYPPPGECRVWYPDRPPGQQPLRATAVPCAVCRAVRG